MSRALCRLRASRSVVWTRAAVRSAMGWEGRAQRLAAEVLALKERVRARERAADDA